MASPQFQQRFRDRMGIVTRSGDFSCEVSENDGSPVSSMGKTPTHGKVVKKLRENASFGQLAALPRVSPPKYTSAAQGSTEPLTSSVPTLPKLHHQSPFLPEIREKVSKKASLGKLNVRSNSTLPLNQVLQHQKTNVSLTEDSRDFQPYTIEDYKVLKRKTPVRMGGLGPSTVGTETWAVARRTRDRRLAYSQALKKAS